MRKPLKAKLAKGDRVANLLEKEIRKGQFAKGSRLPSVRELAGVFSVSRSSITAGMKLLEGKGLLLRKPRSGVYVSLGPDTTFAKPLSRQMKPRMRRAEMIAAQIERGISSGDFPLGQALPLKKALVFRFRTSIVTLNKALATLTSKGLIRKSGASFVVGYPNPLRARLKDHVNLIPAKGLSGEHVWSGHLKEEFQYALGNELAKFGIAFWGQPYPLSGRKEPYRLPSMAKALGLTYVVGTENWTHRVVGNQMSMLAKELKRLNSMGPRVILFNCAHILRSFPELNFEPYHRVYPFMVDNPRSGEMTVRFLEMLGHRHMAFLQYARYTWNSLRFQGATTAMEQMPDRSGSITMFEAMGRAGPLKEITKRTPEQRDRDLVRIIDRWYPKTDLSEGVSTRQMASAIHRIVLADQHRPAMRVPFEKALRNKSITAWVCSDPAVAVTARRFLFRKRIRVPEQISLISIGDSPGISRQRITACNLGLERMGYQAAHCLLGDLPVKRDGRGVVECPPRIVDRGSVGRV